MYINKKEIMGKINIKYNIEIFLEIFCALN